MLLSTFGVSDAFDTVAFTYAYPELADTVPDNDNTGNAPPAGTGPGWKHDDHVGHVHPDPDDTNVPDNPCTDDKFTLTWPVDATAPELRTVNDHDPAAPSTNGTPPSAATTRRSVPVTAGTTGE